MGKLYGTLQHRGVCLTISFGLVDTNDAEMLRVLDKWKIHGYAHCCRVSVVSLEVNEGLLPHPDIVQSRMWVTCIGSIILYVWAYVLHRDSGEQHVTSSKML